MIELASMPLEDYKAICNATRIRTGQDKLYKSFEIAEDLLNLDKPKKIYAHNILREANNEISYAYYMIKTIDTNKINYADYMMRVANNTPKIISKEEVEMINE